MPTNHPIGRKKNVTGVADPNSLRVNGSESVRRDAMGTFIRNAATLYDAIRSRKKQETQRRAQPRK